MRTFASVFFSFFILHASAQRECASQAYNAQKSSAARQTADQFIKHQSPVLTSSINENAIAGKVEKTIRIPVVVHVLYNTAAQNISDAVIKSGIAALNRDFRKQNKDTAAIPERFKAFAADVQIEFDLATADPRGVATTGIVRKQTSVSAWTMDDKIKFSAHGGADAWDSKNYLNIWLGNTRRLLGYATMPGGDEKLDGLVIHFESFGTVNSSGPYNLGRTAVHEAGHWLGLHHIWGDDFCGDDGVDDTPVQGGFTTGCPATFRSSCSNGSAGDMFMNYMDFTNDACMNLFTHGQKERMRLMFKKGGPRHALLSSTGLNTPWHEAPPQTNDTALHMFTVQIYPNPSKDAVAIRFNGPESGINATLNIISASGAIVKTILITSAKQQINIAQLNAGLYLFKITMNNSKTYHKVLKL